MKKVLLSIGVCFVLPLILTGQTVIKTYEFKNGQWFNGKDFTPATWYISKGVLSRKAPSKVDSVIDLKNRWVIPPMGDAYCMSVAGNSLAPSQLKSYMAEGIYYLQILGNTKDDRASVQNLVNTPDAPDAIFANGAITTTLGYPFLQCEGPAHKIRTEQDMKDRYPFLKEQRTRLGDCYWFLDNKDAIDRNWTAIKAQRPGVIFIVMHDVTNSGGKEGKGLSEEVAKAVIKKAHKNDLRVFAHVHNADDLRLAVKLGADGIANLPGYDWDGKGDNKSYLLTDDDLKKLAKKKTAVVMLFGHAQATGPNAAVQAFHAATFKRLTEAGVLLAVGSDDPLRTTRTEINYLFHLDGVNYSTLLRVLCENTPRTIFPGRKVGKIEDGYEASFLVLPSNPLENLLKMRLIDIRVKNGILLK